MDTSIEAHTMLSFRNRLLILLIGLVVGAQTVTLITALPITNSTERKRADEALKLGAANATQLLALRERQIENAIPGLIKDYVLLEAVSKGDNETVKSVLGNHARRILADLMVALDPDGKLLGFGEGTAPVDAELVAALNAQLDQGAGDTHLVTTSTGVYRVFVASAPDVAQLVLGFKLDTTLAMELQKLAGDGVQVAFLATMDGKSRLAATTLSSLESAERMTASPLPAHPDVVTIGGVEYLATASHMSDSEPDLDIALLKPMDLVLEPYRDMRDTLAKIFGFTLLAAAIAGIYLGRSAARPVQWLAAGAARVAAGDYSERVVAAGGQELEHLADSFNSMQRGIAERESQLLHVVRHDSATGLPNRVQLEEWLNLRLQHAEGAGRIVIVQLVITNLQEISATLGFEIAERLVSHLAQQLSECKDEPGLVARLDSAAFAVAVPLPEGRDAMEFAQKLRDRASAPFTTSGITLHATMVLGVAIAPQDGATATEALRCAHAAIEAATLQRTSIAAFAVSNDEAQRRRLKLGADLPMALANGELFLHFQPKIRLTDGRISGVEALVRWKHPEFGLVPPVEFIPIAERTGASAALTRFVLHSALRQLADWHREGYPLEVAVNLSATDILDAGVLRHILEALSAVKIPAGSLTLEITESVLVHEPAAARRNMEMLRVAGVRFSIDDFGTGYSSLSQLRELAADELKIDQSFVRSTARGKEHVAVLRAIIDLAHDLGLRTVAEGVETAEQWTLLHELGCKYAQGYLISKPALAGDLQPLLKASRAIRTAGADQTESLRVLELRRSES